ncbi:MAG: hypothetical protein J5714_00335 [Alphaproteobacteria bacterium]|nr:hypothetical protein [Alphaproteobacteria bacterium]
MRSRIFSFIVALCGLWFGAAHANWEYSGGYMYNPDYTDSGSRAAISIRGGATYALAKMRNDAPMVFAYCVNTETGDVQDWSGTCPDGFEYATGGLNSVGLDKMSQVSFAAGASVGWILPNTPQWRLELGWDHFSDVDYNKPRLFSGNMQLSNGMTLDVSMGNVQSTMATDIISFMAFYDFFDGIQKPIRTMIPYIGIGFGYADTKTEMHFYDDTGELYGYPILEDFGTSDDVMMDFYPSTTNTTNVAGVVALGFSYGINENLFFDFGARAAYLPHVKYTLSNSDGTRHLDWFSAKNLIYANVMLGLRVEF